MFLYKLTVDFNRYFMEMDFCVKKPYETDLNPLSWLFHKNYRTNYACLLKSDSISAS